MNAIDKQYLESQIKSHRSAHLVRFLRDLAVATIIVIALTKEIFGGHGKLACLIVIVYAQLTALVHNGILQVESNSGKLDIVNGGESAASRELWDAMWVAANGIHMRYMSLYLCLEIGLLGVAFWKLFS